MSRNNSNNNLSGIVISAVAGGLAVGALALLFSPKNGKQWRKLINDTYEDVSDQACEWKESVEEAGEDIVGCASEWCEKAKDLYHEVFPDKSNQFSGQVFAIAGLAGGILAAAGTLYYLNHTPKGTSSFRYITNRTGELVNTLSDKSDDWKKLISIILRKFNKTFNVQAGRMEEKLARAGDTVSDILDWAHIGVGLIQKLRKRS